MASTIFRPIDDPVYTATGNLAPIDKDTIRRTMCVMASQQNGDGSVAAPLNSPLGGKSVRFQFANTTSTPLRWANCAVRIQMVIHKLLDVAANDPKYNHPSPYTEPNVAKVIPYLPHNCPAWNMTGHLIRGVKLEFNGKEVWKCADNYGTDFTARLIKNHSFESLDNMSQTLFTPYGDYRYTCSSGRDAAPIDAGANNAFASERGLKMACKDALDASYPMHVGADGGANQFFGMTQSTNPYAGGDNLRERCRRWMDERTHQRVIEKIISFQDFFPRFPDGFIKNLSKVDITIDFTNTLDHLMHFTDDTALHGGVSVIKCDLILDKYISSPMQATGAVEEKKEGQMDIIPFLYTEVINQAYTPGSQFLQPAVKNLDTVMLCLMAKGVNNGKADVNRMAYQSTGQFVLFNNGLAPDTLIRKNTDQPVIANGTYGLDIESIHMSYGQVSYPELPIETMSIDMIGYRCTNVSTLYYEYLKATQKLNRRETSPSVPLELFKSTSPFVMLRPWADDAPRRSDAAPLIFNMKGGSACTVQLVMFRYVVMVISPDGTVNLND